MQVCTSLWTDNHASTPPLSFLQAGCPSCRPTNSVKALKGCPRATNVELIDCRIREVTYPRKLAPIGPISRTRLASASPSISGGGHASLSILMSLHVTRVGALARPGGITIRTPEWRHPCSAPPRASTIKLTRKLPQSRHRIALRFISLSFTCTLYLKKTRHQTLAHNFRKC